MPPYQAIEGTRNYQVSNYDQGIGTELGLGALHDVEFPYSVACSAIAVLREAAACLQDDLDERPGMIETHLADWEGGHRRNPWPDGFDGVWENECLPNLQGSGTGIGIIAALITLANAIEDAWDAALAENELRARNREEYDRQKELRVAYGEWPPGQGDLSDQPTSGSDNDGYDMDLISDLAPGP